MLKISRNYQIGFYFVVMIFGAFLFFYFYRQTSLTDNNFSEIGLSRTQSGTVIPITGVTIDTALFNSDKFKNLRADVAPAQNYQIGKRDPFEPEATAP
ncbi:MAG TPA: hypothetical protein VMD74_04420 [Candidatus Methylomirabilis sp.]|nr:hypothetical protein [Candidatus Methylomirabilis sp.]